MLIIFLNNKYKTYLCKNIFKKINLMTEEQKPKKKNGCLMGCGTFILVFIIIGAISSVVQEEQNEADKVELKSEVDKCNEGIEEICQKLLQGNKDVGGQITNPLYRETFLEKQNQINEIKRKKEAMQLKIVRCRRLIKQNLKDPGSFKVLNSYSEQVSTGIVRYSATNSFGARVQEAFDCNRF